MHPTFNALVLHSSFRILIRNAITCRLLPILIAFTGVAHRAESEKAPATLIARVDKLFSEWNKSDSPGCSLAISQNGKLIYKQGYGMANLEPSVPITPKSVFHVCSIAKPFTAISILLLAERGRLSRDDEVRKYIPEFSNYSQPFTIRQLLNHTSGLRDVFLLMGLSRPRGDDDDLNETVVKVLARQRGLNFTPGTEFDYNNGGYVLLGVIVKRVSGQSIRQFAEENIFRPLGMIHTHFHDDISKIVSGRVSGYTGSPGGWRMAGNGDTGGLVGNAGLFTTAEDLLLWTQSLTDARVVNRALLAEMQKPTILSNGETNGYGLGLEISEYRGVPTIGHGGGDRGFAARVASYPTIGLGIAILFNVDSVGPAVNSLAQAVADLFLEEPLSHYSPPIPGTNSGQLTTNLFLSAEEMTVKAGLYRDPTAENVARILVRDGKLRISANAGTRRSVELTPVSRDRFVVPGTPVVIEFLPLESGKPQMIRVSGDGPRPVVRHRVEPFTPSHAELTRFEGHYISDELETTYSVSVRDSNLLLQIPGRADTILQPIFSDTFAGGPVSVVKFSRSADKVVSGFTVHASGVRGLRFKRQSP